MSELRTSTDAPDGFPFEEKNARFHFGFTKDAMRAHRQQYFTDGVDFILHKKKLFLSPAGVKKMRAATGMPPASKTSGGSITDDPGALKPQPYKKTAPPEPVTLVIVRSSRNKRIIHAALEVADPTRLKQLMRLRVNPKMGERLVRGMKVPALLVDGYTDLYDVAGHYPRKKGVW